MSNGQIWSYEALSCLDSVREDYEDSELDKFHCESKHSFIDRLQSMIDLVSSLASSHLASCIIKDRS